MSHCVLPGPAWLHTHKLTCIGCTQTPKLTDSAKNLPAIVLLHCAAAIRPLLWESAGVMKSRNERGSERWKKALLDCEKRVAVQWLFKFFNSSVSGPFDVTVCVLESRTEDKVHIWFSGLTKTTSPNCAFVLWLGHMGICQSCRLSSSVNSWLTTVTSLCYKFKRFACSLIWQLCEVQNPLWPAAIHHFYFAFKGKRPDFISGLSLLALEWYETEYMPVCAAAEFLC